MTNLFLIKTAHCKTVILYNVEEKRVTILDKNKTNVPEFDLNKVKYTRAGGIFEEVTENELWTYIEKNLLSPSAEIVFFENWEG